jgi:transcriptional regulator with XRE-family HTH domain
VRRAQGRRLRRARNAADLTLTEVAYRLRDAGITISPQAISAWERGESAPRLGIRVEVCRIIGVDPHDIFGNEL